MQKDDERRKAIEANLKVLREAEARSGHIARILMVEIRLDGSWFVQVSNCTLDDELGMAEIALTNAREKFKESRLRGLPPAPTKQMN